MEYFPKRALFHRDNIERSIQFSRLKKFAFASFLQPIYGIDNKAYVGFEKRYVENNPQKIKLNRQYYALARDYFEELSAKYSGPNVCIRDISGNSINHIKVRAYVDDGHLIDVGNEGVANTMLSQLDECEMIPWRTQ